MFTTTPRSPSSPGSVRAMAPAASLITLNVPTRFTLTTVLKASRSCGSPCRPTVRCAQPMPAQLTADPELTGLGGPLDRLAHRLRIADVAGDVRGPVTEL